MSNWNQNFTVLIRASRPTLWGNWALNANIQPGMIGTVESNTGNFSPLSESIPDAVIVETKLSQKWDVKSSDIKITKSNITLDGSATDPETNTKITAGLAVSWGFESAGSIASSFAQTKECTIRDFPTLIENHMEWLTQKAKASNMITDDGIVQGFCIITDVIYTKSGLNVGANSEKSSFSIEGSASGVNELTGDSLSGKGSYSSTSETASMEKHLWPSSAGMLAVGEVPIAFALASFHGKLLIPNWTKKLDSFVLILDNSHGGTYIAYGTLTYQVDGTKITKTVSDIGISGGRTGAISDIPLNAQNLVFTVTYTEMFDHDTNVLNWGSPINQWFSGVRHVDVYGVWPGTPSVVDREA